MRVWKSIMAAISFATAALLVIDVSTGFVEPTAKTGLVTLVMAGIGIVFLEMRPLEFDDGSIE